MARLSGAMAPLLALGLATLYTDERGHLWGVTVTDAGRAVEWPEAPTIEADAESCWLQFEQGFDAGMDYVHRPSPADYHAVLTRILPSSKWGTEL